MHTTVNGNEVFYSRTGNTESEKTILFIHGSGMSSILMSGLYGQLQQYNCLAIDLPGHVGSGGQPLTTVSEIAEVVTGVIQNLKATGEITDDLTLAGYSLGGGTALEIAHRGIEGVTRVAILNACDFGNTNAPAIAPPTFDEFNKDSFLIDWVYPEGTVLDENAPDIGKPTEYATYCDLVAAVTYPMKDFENIKIPVIFITGKDDKIALIDNVEALGKLIPNAEVSAIPYHGHSSLFEVPGIYARNIDDFIQHNS